MALSEIELASCAEVDAAAAAGWTTLAPIIPRPAAVALLRNRRRSIGFSALRLIRSCTYRFPNIVFSSASFDPSGRGWTAQPALTPANLLGVAVPAAKSLETG